MGLTRPARVGAEIWAQAGGVLAWVGPSGFLLGICTKNSPKRKAMLLTRRLARKVGAGDRVLLAPWESRVSGRQIRRTGRCFTQQESVMIGLGGVAGRRKDRTGGEGLVLTGFGLPNHRILSHEDPVTQSEDCCGLCESLEA